MLIGIAFLLICACSAMRTHYVQPTIDRPPIYPHADENARASLDRWWQSFDDRDLDALVERALSSNSDLAIAALTVRAAKLTAHITVINPEVGAEYSEQYSKQLSGNAASIRVHSMSTSASYELDLWDQLKAAKDAATWEARATEEDRRSTALALTATTVDLYYQLANLNQRIALGEQSIAYADRTLQLVQALKAAGEVTELEVSEARQSCDSQRASQVELIQEQVVARNALTVLLNGARRPESSEPAMVPDGPPPAVAAGLPVALLERRPDLRAAEMRLRESLARADATRLSFYPAINLTGLMGTSSTELAQIVHNPVGTLAAALTLPFVQFNQAKLTTRIARTQYEQAVIVFRSTLLRALYEVDNALSARAQLAQEGAQLERSLEAGKTAEHVYEVRYHAGAIVLRLWLDAQESRRQAEIAVTNNRLARIQNYVALCQALGGGADRL